MPSDSSSSRSVNTMNVEANHARISALLSQTDLTRCRIKLEFAGVECMQGCQIGWIDRPVCPPWELGGYLAESIWGSLLPLKILFRSLEQLRVLLSDPLEVVPPSTTILTARESLVKVD